MKDCVSLIRWILLAFAFCVPLVEHAANVPSPTWCVRACPDGKASARRLWNGISPLVKEWELGKREETLDWFRKNQFGVTPVGRLVDERICERSVEVRDVKASGPVAVWVRGPVADSSIERVEAAPGGRKFSITAPYERLRMDEEALPDNARLMGPPQGERPVGRNQTQCDRMT